MATRIQLRRDTAANWADANPTLAVGEAGFDTTNNQLRIGDGDRNWNALTPLDGSNINLSIYATKAELNSETSARANGDAALQAQVNQGMAMISDLDDRVTEIEENGGGGPGPAPGTVLNWNWQGTGFFSAPTTGGIKIHPDGTSIYVSKTNAAGDDISTEFLNEVMAGNLFSLQVPARTAGDNSDPNQFQQFSIQQNPVSQGNWWNVATSRIIDANTTVPWQVGSTNLDMVVQMAPQTRFLLTDPEEQPEDIITDPQLLAHWDDYKAQQGWEADYIPTQQDVNRYFNDVDQVQQATLRDLAERLDAVEARPVGIQHAPADDDQWVSRNGEWDRLDVTAPMTLEFEYKGKEWWATPKEGECFVHEQDSQLFFASKDDNGLPANAVFDSVIKPGVSLLIAKATDRSKWVHFTATTAPSPQTWGRNFGVDLNSQGKAFKKGDTVTIQFNIQPPVDVGAELTALKRQITALKGELTKLKKASG